MLARLYRKPGSLLWWYSYVGPDGQLGERCTGHANLDAATAAAGEPVTPPPRATRRASDQTPVASYKVGDALDDFLTFGEISRSAPTLECYEQRGGHVVRLLGAVDLAALQVDDVHGYCAARLQEGAARESVRKELCVLRQSLRLARDRSRFGRDPDGVIPRFRARYTPRRRWLSEGEFERLLDQLPPVRQRWVMVAVCTGGRLSEIESLQLGDINWGRKQIHVRGTKTDKADRFVPLHQPLAEILKACTAGITDPATPLVEHWHNVRRDLQQACERAGIERVSPNDLRRTFASWLKQAETDSLVVAKLLGHTSSRMVELVYGHLNQRALDEAVSRLPIPNRRRAARRPSKRPHRPNAQTIH